MSTSLAQQLQRLKTPQTQILASSKRGVSILFDAKEAQNLTFDGAFDLGLEGLKALEELDPSFKEFEHQLFSEAAKGLQRAVQSKEANKKVDEHIRKFLVFLSPHLLLKPSLLALEWLVKRFQIGEYNAEDLVMLALPYHGTRTFVLIVRAIPSIWSTHSPWHWLKGVVDNGIPLDVHSIHSIFAHSTALLRKLCEFTISAHKTYPSGQAGKLQTLFTFSCATLIGVLRREGGCNQSTLSCMLPLLRYGLASTTPCLVAGCLAVIAYIVTAAALAERATHEIIMQLLAVKVPSLQHEAASVMLLLFSAQSRLGVEVTLPDSATSRLLTSNWVIEALKKLSQTVEGKRVDVIKLLLPIMKALFGEIYDSSSSIAATSMITSILQNMPLQPDQATQAIELLFDNLPSSGRHMKIQKWFRVTCQHVETCYPTVYDAELNKAFADKEDLAKKLQNILGLQTLSLGNGESTVATPRSLVTHLLHPSELVRVTAVINLGSSFKKLLEDDKKWVSSALQDRLKDDSMKVVMTVLKLPCIRSILGNTDDALTETLVNLLDITPYSKWTIESLKVVLTLLCEVINDEGNDLRQMCLLLAMLPPLIVNPSIFPTVAATDFGSDCALIQVIKEKLSKAEKDVQSSGMCLLWATQEALNCAPPEALELVSWRLRRQREIPALELSLLLRMMYASIANLKTSKDALRCCQLLLNIKNRAQKIGDPEVPQFPQPTKSVLVQQAYNTIVKANVLPYEGIIAVLTCLASRKSVSKFARLKSQNVLRWCDLHEAGERKAEDELEFYATLFEILVKMSTLDSKSLLEVLPSSVKTLQTFMMKNFNELPSQFHFLSLLWSRKQAEPENIIRAVNFCVALLKHSKEVSFLLQCNNEATFVPSLLCLLMHEVREVREATLKLLKELTLCNVPSSLNYHTMLVAIIARDDELLQDNNQLSVVMYTLLSTDPDVQKLFSGSESNLRSQSASISEMRMCLVDHVCSPYTPRHIAAQILTSLKYVRSKDILLALISFGSSLLKQKSTDNQLDSDTWCFISSMLDRIQDEYSAAVLEKDESLELLKSAFRSSLCHGDQSVASTTLNSICDAVFAKMGTTRSKLISMVLEIPENLGLNREITALLRRIVLDGNLINEQLLRLMSPVPQLNTRSRNKRTTLTPENTPSVPGSESWRQGMVLLEALQEQKQTKLKEASVLLPILFRILKICIESGGDQEYTKQLVLGCLSNCISSIDIEATSNKNNLDIELLVLCLRGTNNPHTQHQALLLLAHTAHTVPEGLLHHLVSVFTFMGSLVMRYDDAYSFHVIGEVIDKLVPVIIKSKKNQGAAVSVLRVFVDSMPDIPSHRRAPIFSRLMNVLSWQRLWLFVVLVSEAPVSPRKDKSDNSVTMLEDDKISKKACALELANTVPLSALLSMCSYTLNYLSVLAAIKYNDQNQVMHGDMLRQLLNDCGADNLFDPITRPINETRRLQANCLSLLIDLLGARGQDEADTGEEENLYKQLMEFLMSYLGLLSRQELSNKGLTFGKYWSRMLEYAYSLLDKVNRLLPTNQFLAVVRSVLEVGRDEGVKAKALEVLGSRLESRAAAQVAPEEQNELLQLVPSLKALAINGGVAADKALYCLRILAKQMAEKYPHIFGPVVIALLKLLEDKDESKNASIQAGAFVCVAELTASLKAAAVPMIPRLVPLVLENVIQHSQPSPASSDLVLLGAISALQRLVQTLPNFLSPFLASILRETSILSASMPNHVSAKVEAAIKPRLGVIRSGMSHIALRILLPAISSVTTELRDDTSTLPALGPLLEILSATFTELERSQVNAHISQLTTYFLSALELRADWESKTGVRSEDERQLIADTESQVISALVSLVMKLPEFLFKPMYFQLSTWSSQAEQSPALRSRCITFYRCSTVLASNLKGLFVVYAFHFLKQASSLLKQCHSASEEESLFGDGEDAEQLCCLLLESVLETLLTVCTHDKQNFVNKECFDTLMQPLVDQLENMIGGEDRLKSRCKQLVSPCLAQFARATADDVLWKQLHYQMLLKTRHNSPTVRLVAVGAVKALAGALGEELLPLLPEAVPFLAELLEDEDTEVEAACQDAVRDLEKILGEPLHKYF